METSTEMDYQKLLKISDAWLKYAILLNLDHKPDDFIAIQNMALADDRIRRYLSDITSLAKTYLVGVYATPHYFYLLY